VIGIDTFGNLQNTDDLYAIDLERQSEQNGPLRDAIHKDLLNFVLQGSLAGNSKVFYAFGAIAKATNPQLMVVELR
jgi:hypothetical protein